MSNPTLTASALREDFDRGFAVARRSNDEARRAAFMALRAHGEPFVVSVADVAGVHVDRKIVPVPTLSKAPAGLLGVASLRGVMTPVYDLGLLLGVPDRAATADVSPWRWMMVVRERADDPSSASLGFAFAAFESHVRARREELRPTPVGSTHHFVKFALAVDGVARPLADVKALFEAVKGPQPR